MGHLVSDHYQVEDLQTMTRSDMLPTRYAWIDFNINGPQNRLYFSKFSEGFNLEAHESVESFTLRLQNWREEKEKLRVICAAHLPEDAYQLIQNSNKIDRAILFCGNKVRANNLLRDYSKIRRACFGYGDVLKTMQGWEREQKTSVLFYELQSVQTFNKYNANLKALTDSSISLKESRNHFNKYCEKFLRENLFVYDSVNAKYSKLRPNEDSLLSDKVNKEALLSFVRDSLLETNIILDQINVLLKSTNNPKKLAYLRYPIRDIFIVIRDSYLEASFSETTYYAVVLLNEEERRRLKESANKHIMLTYFLSASSVPPESKLSEGEVLMEITVPTKGVGQARCTGYIRLSNRIMFNLGNYMKVLAVSEDGKKLKAVLSQLPEEGTADWNNKEQCIALNQRWLNSQQQKFGGQWFSLILHDEQAIASKINAVQKEKQQIKDSVIFTRELLKIKIGQPVEKIQPHLEAIINSSDNSNKLTVLLALCDLYWDRKLETKFRATVKRLGQLKEVNNKDPRREIFKIYDRFLEGGKKEREEVLSDLRKQDQILTSTPNYMANDAYCLLSNIRIACLGLMGSYEEELEVIDRMIAIYSVCQGTSCRDYTRLNNLKIAVVARKDEELNMQEVLKKSSLWTSKIPLDKLKQPAVSEILAIDTSKLDFTLFN